MERFILTTTKGFINEEGETTGQLSMAARMSEEGAKAFQKHINKRLKKLHVRLVNAARFFVVKSATENYLSARYREQRGLEADIDYAAVFDYDIASKLAEKMNHTEAGKSFRHQWGVQRVTA